MLATYNVIDNYDNTETDAVSTGLFDIPSPSLADFIVGFPTQSGELRQSRLPI